MSESKATGAPAGAAQKFRNSSLLDAAQGRMPARPPVWIMRQAGRYLADYRRVRSLFPNFLDFCRSPEHVAEVTVQPVDQIGVDAAILFSDILVLLPPMGLSVEFQEKKGPVVANPLRDDAVIAALPDGDLNSELGYVFEGIRLSKKALGDRVPLIGFAGGPFTVASYMVEGGSSKELARLKALMFSRPEVFTVLIGKLASVTSAYLREQVRHGADVITIMDSWAGYLGPEAYRALVFPHTRKIIATLKAEFPHVPVVHYANGAPHLLPHFTELGADVVGLDWRVNLGDALRAYPNQIFQGNLDPCALYASPQQIAAKVKAMKAEVGGRAHVYNLGHGILPDISPDHARAFVDSVHES
ncbi:MAG: uroporphyrinogen decarboxylase [Fibrobacteres bacterium]|nr:uroporphyrinogen decarboxylase [Fibrobacterota bacterium]